MLAVIGAALVAAGCAGLGFMAVRRLALREKTLRAWVLFTERAEREIGFCLTPLPGLAALLTHPSLARFALYLQKEYTPFCGRAFSEIWESAARELDLPEEDRELVSSIGGILGRYDADNQARGLAQTRARLNEALSRASLARAAYSRVYGALGVVCGLTALIVFAL